MKKAVLSQAQGRLKLAERAFVALCNSEPDRETFDINWLDFLVQWKGTYTKVQQAAKDGPRETQWFGAVNKERRNDPLLRYLYEARNDGEHGTEASAKHSPNSVKFTSYGKRVGIKVSPSGGIYLGPDGKPVVWDDGKIVESVAFDPAESTLFEVAERDSAKKVPPPTSHLGSPMEPKPYIAADLGLKWLRSLVATAVAMTEP